jgi:uncharacterized cupin superfamily protein
MTSKPETPMPKITRFDLPATAPEIDFPREDRREIGAPERRTWVLYESAPAGMTAGIWECEVGRWRIQMDPNEHEYMRRTARSPRSAPARRSSSRPASPARSR